MKVPVYIRADIKPGIIRMDTVYEHTGPSHRPNISGLTFLTYPG